MANYCSNLVEVTFHDKEKAKAFRKWMIEMSDCSLAERKLKDWEDMPPLTIGKFDNSDRFIFELYYSTREQDKDGDMNMVFQFESKWAPATTTLIKIAREYAFSFTNGYDEPGMGIYGEGKYDYTENSYSERDLDSDDIPEYEEEEDDSNRYDIMDERLAEKEFEIVDITDLNIANL